MKMGVPQQSCKGITHKTTSQDRLGIVCNMVTEDSLVAVSLTLIQMALATRNSGRLTLLTVLVPSGHGSLELEHCA
jgi:hypothetical protein